MRLVARQVITHEDVEQMRLIFNECIAFMTKPCHPVGHWEQMVWWRNLPSKVKRFKAFVYAMEDEPKVTVAYSLLQWHKDGRTTPLFGITQSARGKNIARQIIQHYLHEAEGPLHGEERSDHGAIIKLNREAGWELLEETNGVRKLYHPNKARTYPDYEGLLEYWDAP